MLETVIKRDRDLGTPARVSEKTVTLTIDGQEITVAEGTSLMRAAAEAGINIPKLCATDSLEPFGSCRLCLVQIEGRRGYPASCTTPAENGMVVFTETPKLHDLRRGVMELYISDHPLDCLTCPANGEDVYKRQGWGCSLAGLPYAMQQAVQLGGRDAGVRLAVQHHRRRLGAQAQAVHRLQREVAVARAGVEITAQRLARVLGQLFAAHRLARLGAAHFQRVAAGGFAAEMGVEGDDAVDFGAGQVQGLGDGLHRLGRNTAQFMLDRVQHRQQRAGLVFQAGQDVGGGRDRGAGGRLGGVQGQGAATGAARGCQIGFCLALTHGGRLQ